MKFYFPDSHDLVDPSFDFETERRSYSGSRQRSQLYAHEVFDSPPYDGMLLSLATVDQSSKAKRYNFGQVRSLEDNGIRDFLRLDHFGPSFRLRAMGDCGSFSYLNEPEPPFSVQNVLDFYLRCGFDNGISLDHVILGFINDNSVPIPDEWKRRHSLTLELADQFLRLTPKRGCRFQPIGAAQGWSPASYRDSVEKLQRMGYDYIALGGMVPLKTKEILAVLEEIQKIRRPSTKLHLLGISRFEAVERFAGFGVYSLDSTAPLKQAFMDERDNYHTPGRTYTAVRIPQVDGNPKLKRLVLSGEVNQDHATRLERDCLRSVTAFAKRGGSLDSAIESLKEYEALWHGTKDDSGAYRVTLQDRPWEKCPCAVCGTLGVHVVIFRGAERNRRRGFHNLFVLRQKLISLND
jgi:hypothetical protein